jgi:P27 family predicted phage terminase small subunit
MGLRGPAKQPSVVRYVRGDPSKEGFNEKEPKPPLTTLDPPAGLDGLARDKWMDTVPKLVQMGVFTDADRMTWERYCEEYALWVHAKAMVQRHGDVMIMRPKKEGDPPYMQVSPYASRMDRYSASLLRMEQQYGLTPSSRSQVNIHPSAADDPLETFIARRGA